MLGIEAELVVVETLGDQRRDVPVEALGGTGAFVTEVRQAVLDGRADAAVHSAKDLPTAVVEGLCIAAVPERGDPRDALVGGTLAELAPGALVGTGSARRRVQMAHLRPDLEFGSLRGNIETRLASAGDPFDAVVVAAAALQRLGLSNRVDELLDVETFVPQPAQGALAVECRTDDAGTIAALKMIEHRDSRAAVDCERAFLAEIGAGCGAPLGAYAELDGEGTIRAIGVLADGSGAVHRHEVTGTDPADVGVSLAKHLRELAPSGGSTGS